MPPFPQRCELVPDVAVAKSAVACGVGSQLDDTTTILQHLQEDLCCADLEKMAPQLWILTTYSGANINALHRQRVKGREIIITEEPKLHLVWIHNRVFIKPLPKYLLSHKFWTMYLDTPGNKTTELFKSVRSAALGFLRTYFYLIRHESDFHIAQQDGNRLIPADVDWESFCQMRAFLGAIEDSDVSLRYHYGELRLTRLNFYAPFLLGRFNFEQIHGQYGDIFGRLFAPLLFLFALISTILSSMQVALAADQLIAAQWKPLWYLSRWVSVISLAGAGVVVIWFATLWTWMFLDEWIFTLKRRRTRLRSARQRTRNNTP